jgi:hypothetical protein
MKYRKFSKLEKKQMQAEQLRTAMHGEGLYLYENHSPSDLSLPRPTKSGLRIVQAGSQFQGDNYYMQLVQQGHLRLIKELQSPEQERALMEQQEDKLILDQPDTVTPKGKVEHVVDQDVPVQKLNETDSEEQPEVLLTEQPEGFVIVGD